MTGLHNLGQCWVPCDVHGKRGYTSRAAAKRIRRGHPNRKHLSVYACTATPGLWHLGHKPPDLIAGRITRDQLIERRSA